MYRIRDVAHATTLHQAWTRTRRWRSEMSWFSSSSSGVSYHLTRRGTAGAGSVLPVQTATLVTSRELEHWSSADKTDGSGFKYATISITAQISVHPYFRHQAHKTHRVNSDKRKGRNTAKGPADDASSLAAQETKERYWAKTH